MAEKNLIKIYVDASSAKRVDIIIKHYTDFIGIVDGYTEGLRYMIECEKESNSHREIGDLGVRVKTSGSTSDPTAKKAIRNVMTREALINCDFSGDVMAGVNRAEELNQVIQTFSHGWDISRISRLTRSIMQLAIYEINYLEDVPMAVAISEAVRLAKKYDGDDTGAFVNGILGAYARSLAPTED